MNDFRDGLSLSLYTACGRSVFRDFGLRGEAALNDVRVTVTDDARILLAAGATPVRFLCLRRPDPEVAKASLFLGDAWERGYGDLQWQSRNPSRFMPWYFVARRRGGDVGYGVRTQPGAFAMWNVDDHGVTLWLDVRSGSEGVVLDGRTVELCTVVRHADPARRSAPPMEFARRFCAMLCPEPLMPAQPLYGGNNWYYAYGRSSRADILADADYIAALAPDAENRPFMVVDDGWQLDRADGGATTLWERGNGHFGDMRALAEELAARNVRPGIWQRPLHAPNTRLPREWFLANRPEDLDPSRPEVLDIVRGDIRRLADWGYRLVKHDFTTFDVFGRWGFEIRTFPSDGAGVRFHDRSRTSCEIILGLYRAIREAAGERAMVLGCNTLSHLAAGLVHAARTGDDTSGRVWDRTRRMGVNALAFRGCHHGTFYAADADCVGIRGDIPMRLNLQWAELLACSGTPFFASIRPGILSKSEFRKMREFFRIAAKGGLGAIPLDALSNTTPRRWLYADGTRRTFNWDDPSDPRPDFTLAP